MKNLLRYNPFIIGLFAISFFIFLSCQKEVSLDNPTPVVPDFVTKVNSSVSGFVTDENNQAMQNASVAVGNQTVVTDEYGYFEVRNTDVIKTAATVTVTKPGFFKGIKTWMAETNRSAFFRIKLIPKTNSGSFTATAGGNVSLTNGLSITFPANAIVNATTGAAYTGTVNIAAYWIDPTAADLDKIMPGDLRGITTGNAMQTLTTYGMAAVEMTGAGGEQLQVATGKKASLSMPIPAAISATAPASIPLWHFDEAKGLWMEEGAATKSGNNYVGDVSHFSFWNYDVPSNFVQFNCTVVDAAGTPVQHAFVKITTTTPPYSFRYGYTDSTGYVAGAVPNNASLLLEVLGEWGCTTPLYSQAFTTTNVNVSLGTITIATSNTATLSGNVINCTGQPVTNGYVIMIRNGMNFRYNLTATGAFSFTASLCSTNNNVHLIAEDITAMQQSTAMLFSLVPGSNTIGTLTACGVSTQQYINYTVNGTPYAFTAPADSINMYGQGTTGSFTVYGTRSSNNDFISMMIGTAGIGVGTQQPLQLFTATQIVSVVPTPPAGVTVSITEYGPIGGFVSGNFSGLIPGIPANYSVVCNFRVRRTI